MAHAFPETEIPELKRLTEDLDRGVFWKRWGPFLSERQWATVREDYSKDGNPWQYFPHDHSRSRAYRWGEDGLMGWTDHKCRLCFAPAFWNGKDPILKERLFGLSGPEGNHGEDVKELYYYLDSTPTHSYAKALYKYPQAEFPYGRLREENSRRSRLEREFELVDTGVFDEGRYWDIEVEYAKASQDDNLICITAHNRGPEAATLWILPTLWFRNTWTWGPLDEEAVVKPKLSKSGPNSVLVEHENMGWFMWHAEGPGEFLFTENDTNLKRLFNRPNPQPYVKDAFHEVVVHGRREAVNPEQVGTKAAAVYKLEVGPGENRVVRLRLQGAQTVTTSPFGPRFDELFQLRKGEADEFFRERMPANLSEAHRVISRQAYAGLFWSKQFYNIVIPRWLNGDPSEPVPPPERRAIRNSDWDSLYSRDVISMPDKWEYPYFCTWDLAFHAVSFCNVDPIFAKKQLTMLLREWYSHPNGALPAYEWNFSDVNPPVHAWSVWKTYRLPWMKGHKDRPFLESAFQKLLLNFTWWVNRKDPEGNNLFGGGFLGLDNVGVFDRSKPLPMGGSLRQADGTAWMAFYCVQMFAMAIELAQENPVYEDLASKFFEHFVLIVHAMNEFGGTGLWDPQDGFYYDQLDLNGTTVPMRVRSIVGFIPLFATTLAPATYLSGLDGLRKRIRWFLKYRPNLARHLVETNLENSTTRMLTIPNRKKIESMVRYLFDEDEFLSPYGIRSVSKAHESHPYVYWANGQPYSVDYEPGEGLTGMFGGNSNWRGPVWMPINYLIVESLRIYGKFYGETFMVEFPTRSGNMVTLGDAARLLAERLLSIFEPDETGHRPCHGNDERYASDPNWKELLQFHEYFHADEGRGCGASHQTGWTALITDLLNLDSAWDETLHEPPCGVK